MSLYTHTLRGQESEAVAKLPDLSQPNIESSETEGKAGLSVWSIGAGVNGKSESSSSTVSRIKFAIFVRLPQGGV